MAAKVDTLLDVPKLPNTLLQKQERKALPTYSSKGITIVAFVLGTVKNVQREESITILTDEHLGLGLDGKSKRNNF